MWKLGDCVRKAQWRGRDSEQREREFLTMWEGVADALGRDCGLGEIS